MSKRFIKPTPAEVTAYALTIGYKLDGEQFCDYYESRGWMVGRCPMKNWQAAVRTWRRNSNGSQVFDAESQQRREKAQARDRVKQQEQAYLDEYERRLRAIRSWIGSEHTPGSIGNPAEAERDLLAKANDNFGRDFVRRVLDRVNHRTPAPPAPPVSSLTSNV